MRTVTTRTKTRTSRRGKTRCVARARAEGGEEEGGTSTAKPRRAPAVGLAPKEVLDAIEVPAELVEVRAYVRWEEAGMPSDTTDEWQRREYDEALLDLKVELLRGTTMNEIRARYEMSPVEGGDARMFNEDEDLARRVKAAEALAMNEATSRESEETTEFIESVVGEEEAAVQVGEEAEEETADAVVESSSSSAAPTSQRPEELGLGARVRDDLAAVREHDLKLEDVVDAHAVPARRRRARSPRRLRARRRI